MIANLQQGIIRQAELERVIELRKLQQELKRLTASIKSRMDYGVPVEPGLLAAEVELQTSRRFTFKKIELVIGKDHANWLKNNIEPSVCLRLLISERDDNEEALECGVAACDLEM